VIDASALQMVLVVLTGWLGRQERQALAYLMEENRILRRQLGQQRLQCTDADRQRLAVRGHSTIARILKTHGVSPGAGASYVVTDVSSGALGRHRRD
jgi:hypothetical protein